MTNAGVAILGVVAVVVTAIVMLAVANSPVRDRPTRSKDQLVEGRKASRPMYSKSGYDITPLSRERIEQLARNLSPDERRVLLEKGTERPFCGVLLHQKEQGLYACRLCGLPLFSSGTKFESGTGWPSFCEPIDPAHIPQERDTSHGMTRTEIQCVRCRSHLGHVFEDGPPPTGLRYCLNSLALRFYKSGDDLPVESRTVPTEIGYFAGGCFWGIEDRFQQVPGVMDAVSGYMGGRTIHPTYAQVCSGKTSHAETVRVTFDPRRVTYGELLASFFKFHDPTQRNRQGPDEGTQYRTAIFAANEAQLKLATQYIEALQRSQHFHGRKIVTTVEKAGPFHEAEEYHQDYHAKHGASCQ